LENKRLGRGLDEISDMFLSTSETPPLPNGFSQQILREETCIDCKNIINASAKEPRCRLYTYKEPSLDVPQLMKVDTAIGSYCPNFEGRQNIEMTDRATFTPGKKGMEPEDTGEVEEHVTVQKTVSFPASEQAQQHLRNALFKYLNENHQIKSIELEKTEESIQPRLKKSRKEVVTICIRD
jgi:hypothetical protein